MRAAYKDRQWVLIGDDDSEIARFRTKAQLMKYWNENPDGGKTEEKKVDDEKKDWLDDYEEEIDDEEEEDS